MYGEGNTHTRTCTHAHTHTHTHHKYASIQTDGLEFSNVSWCGVIYVDVAPVHVKQRGLG